MRHGSAADAEIVDFYVFMQNPILKLIWVVEAVFQAPSLSYGIAQNGNIYGSLGKNGWFLALTAMAQNSAFYVSTFAFGKKHVFVAIDNSDFILRISVLKFFDLWYLMLLGKFAGLLV